MLTRSARIRVMSPRQVLRDNAFIVAAVALPVLVAVFFLVASAVPRWTVPPPRYDAVLKVQRWTYEGAQDRVSVDFDVRDDHVVAVLRAVTEKGQARAQRWALVVVDHGTLRAREIPFTVPDRLNDGEPERVIVVPELAASTVSAVAEAPDGYTVRVRTNGGGPGLVGELFGMRSYRQRTTLVSARGRTAPVELPAPFQESYQQTSFVGWVTTDGRP
jgi:hypothetical protein